MAEQVAEVFTEVILAPGYDDGAVEVLQAQEEHPHPRRGAAGAAAARSSGGSTAGCWCSSATPSTPTTTRRRAGRWPAASRPTPATLADLEFAWKACRSVKSNAILLAHDGASVGIGMGQVNRVDSSRLAVTRAGDRAAGSVAASDAFFPFPDGLEILLEAGVRAVVQPGGSVRDDAVVEAARAAGATLYLTGARHFYH